MAELLEKQITIRLKRKSCQQKDCRNNNEDNIELIVFGNQHAKRTGFMCSQCLMDTELLQQINPIEQHSISIKKFMKTLTAKYKEYAQQKNSVNWGPSMLQSQRRQIDQFLKQYELTLLRGTLQIVQFVQERQKKTIEQIKTIHKDLSFENLSLLLAQEDDEEQQRMNVGNELKKITVNIMQWEGQYKMSNEKELKDKHEAVILGFRKSLKHAQECFEKLINVQKNVLKELTTIGQHEQMN